MLWKTKNNMVHADLIRSKLLPLSIHDNDEATVNSLCRYSA